MEPTHLPGPPPPSVPPQPVTHGLSAYDDTVCGYEGSPWEILIFTDTVAEITCEQCKPLVEGNQ